MKTYFQGCKWRGIESQCHSTVIHTYPATIHINQTSGPKGCHHSSQALATDHHHPMPCPFHAAIFAPHGGGCNGDMWHATPNEQRAISLKTAHHIKIRMQRTTISSWPTIEAIIGGDNCFNCQGMAAWKVGNNFEALRKQCQDEGTGWGGGMKIPPCC